MWETGKRQPDAETLIKIAVVFGVSVDYLLGVNANRNDADKTSNVEKQLIVDFRALDGHGKSSVLSFLKS